VETAVAHSLERFNNLSFCRHRDEKKGSTDGGNSTGGQAGDKLLKDREPSFSAKPMSRLGCAYLRRSCVVVISQRPPLGNISALSSKGHASTQVSTSIKVDTKFSPGNRWNRDGEDGCSISHDCLTIRPLRRKSAAPRPQQTTISNQHPVVLRKSSEAAPMSRLASSPKHLPLGT
jgi:hypothetical protein